MIFYFPSHLIVLQTSSRSAGPHWSLPLVAKNKHYQLQTKLEVNKGKLKGMRKKNLRTVSWTDDTKRPQNAFGTLTR